MSAAPSVVTARRRASTTGRSASSIFYFALAARHPAACSPRGSSPAPRRSSPSTSGPRRRSRCPTSWCPSAPTSTLLAGVLRLLRRPPADPGRRRAVGDPAVHRAHRLRLRRSSPGPPPSKSMSLVGIFQTTLYRAVPITFGALSGVLCERAGVVNIAIEGMLLSGRLRRRGRRQHHRQQLDRRLGAAIAGGAAGLASWPSCRSATSSTRSSPAR